MKERPFFPLFFKHRDKLAYLSTKQKGELLEALYAYAADGEQPNEENPIFSLIFSVFKEEIDISAAHYQKTCEKNRRNIEKRWKQSHAE